MAKIKKGKTKVSTASTDSIRSIEDRKHKLLTEKLALIESDINKHGSFDTDEAIKCMYLAFFITYFFSFFFKSTQVYNAKK